jgi:RNA 3'-phosphate cyclase
MSKMIEIDGSHGEGGGQILRTSVALSALTMRPIRISDIRSGRSKPGLRRQHVTGIGLTGRLVSAEISGLEVGSTSLEFIPQERTGGEFTVDVGTAGSISLVLQAVLPAAVLSPAQVSFVLRGGTDVKWSPPIDYMKNVFAPILQILGPRIEIEQIRRGHYPRGGGEVRCRVFPVDKLSPVEIIEFGELAHIHGISHCVRLPSHVAERQAKAAAAVIQKRIGVTPDIITEYYSKGNDPHLGPGSGIVIWGESHNGARVGADSLGERGIRAEEVGKNCANRFVEEISAGLAIDSHLADMLVPYLAMADGTSTIGMTEITSHLTTNISTIGEILGTKMKVTGNDGEPGRLEIQGSALFL